MSTVFYEPGTAVSYGPGTAVLDEPGTAVSAAQPINSPETHQRRVTAPGLRRRKMSGAVSPQGTVCLTAYDYTTASLLDNSGVVDLLLVGDSLSGIIQGHETTLPVTLDEMVYHCRCVSRGVRRALVVGDLPFMTYQISAEQALESAARLVKEGGVGAVKIEGGANLAPTVARLVAAGIPVMGHVGLTPQSFHTLGGHVRQGRTEAQQSHILADARAISDAGAFSIVLECIPDALAAEITASVDCPTIGIGSGNACDGQILVVNDLIGLRVGTPPAFVHPEANLAADLIAATQRFASRVRRSAAQPSISV